jgi:DNA-binding CsgD family transcriptional regulator
LSGNLGENRQNLPGAVTVASLGAYAALVLFLVDGAEQFSALVADGIDIVYLFVAGLCAIMCCGLVFVVQGSLSATASYRYLGSKAGAVTAFGYVSCLLASHVPSPAALCVAFSVLFGYGLALLGLSKGLVLCSLQRHTRWRYAVTSGLIASAVKLLLGVMPSPALGVCIGILIVLASFAPKTIDLRGDPATANELSALDVAKGVAGRNWIFLLGLLLSIAIGAWVWNDVNTNETALFTLNLSARSGVSAGSFLAALLLVFLVRDRSLKRLDALMPVFPVTCIAMNVLNWFLSVWQDGLSIGGGFESPVGAFLGSILIGFPITLLFIVLTARLADKPNSDSLSPAFIYGLFALLVAAFFLLYTMLQSVMAFETSRVVDMSLKVTYLVIAVIYMSVLTQRKAQTAKPLSKLRIEEAAERFLLSKRETEIVQLLMQGRSVPFIAETQFVSQNTVRTHVKRIYTKTGAHSRDELLDIMYDLSENITTRP